MDKIRLILALLPQLIALVREIETLFPNAGNGANKLQLLVELFRSVYDAVDEVKPAFESIKPILIALVSTLVAGFNRLGLFKTVPKAAASPRV